MLRWRASSALSKARPADSAGLIDLGPVEVSEDGRVYIYSFRRDLSTLYLAEGL